MRKGGRFALATIVLAICVAPATACIADDVTIDSPNSNQSFTSGDQIAFTGSCVSTLYSAVATLPWRNPMGFPLYTPYPNKKNSWTSIEPGDSRSSITAPDVTVKTTYTMTVECFDSSHVSLGTASVTITVNPKP